uniref:Uncharacterized protein n=1 Tax=Glossina palpalis gambiensis TaxID=67801 RepID=A0A1B0BWY4_9MUSC
MNALVDSSNEIHWQCPGAGSFAEGADNVSDSVSTIALEGSNLRLVRRGLAPLPTRKSVFPSMLDTIINLKDLKILYASAVHRILSHRSTERFLDWLYLN